MTSNSGFIGHLTNRVYRKVSLFSSVIFLVIASMVAVVLLSLEQDRSLADLKAKVADMVLVGAEHSQQMLMDAHQQQGLSMEALFSEDYEKIGLAEFRATYVRPADQDRISDDYVRQLMDRVTETDEYFRYHTAYDTDPWLSRRALQIQQPFLLVDNIDFALVEDRNGYVPFHLAAADLTGDLTLDLVANRIKRIWREQSRNYLPDAISYSYYRRESGVPYLIVSAPIRLDGRHWGHFVIGYRATEIDVAGARRGREAILVVLIFAGLTVLIYGVSINLSLRPLGGLREGVQRLEQGDLDVSIPVRSRDEIGYLAGAFNNMVASVKSHAEELRISNRKLEQSNADLSVARDQAEAASRAKSTFLANIGHEFRTPLNAISGFAEILEGSLSDAGQRRPLDQIQTSCQSLVRLVDRVLDFSKSEANQISLQESPLEVRSYFERTRTHWTQGTRAKGLEFRLDLDPELPSVIATDPDRLQQILDSLIDNAIKFTRQGHVAILVHAMSDAGEGVVELHIDIQDTGIGIREDQHAEIFKAFTQARDQSINEYGGTGMGLALTRSLVQALNGTIAVTSQVGAGSTFCVTFPAVRVIDAQKVGELPAGAAPEPVGPTGPDEFPAESLADDLSPEVRARLPDLVQLLAREQETCAALAATLTINDVETFAEHMQQLGEQFAYPPLSDWGQQLLEQTAAFDMAGMAQTLNTFDALVAKAREHSA